MNAPAHTPRHPLQDVLYWVLVNYRNAKACRAHGFSIQRHRRRALEIIAEIKGHSK